MHELTRIQAHKATTSPPVLRNKSILQRAAVKPGPAQQAPSTVHDVLRSSGQPLDATTRAIMESRFEHDFSRVRVHNDAQSAASARSVNALAYTVGQDVVFGAGQYAPEIGEGQRLIAHELTHVAQQSASAHVASRQLAIGPVHDRYEREAAFSGQAAMNGANVGNKFSPAQPTLQCAPDTRAQAEETKKKPEIKITPATRTIPQSEAETQAPLAPAPTGLPDKSPSATGTGTSSALPKEGPEIEATVEGSAKEEKVTTNVQVAIPIKPVGSTVIFGQPLVLGEELKAGVSVGPQLGSDRLAQQQAALKISLKALSYELESAKSHVPGLTGLGLGVTGEATVEPAAPFARPELGVKAGLEAEYQIGRTPIYLQGSIGYEVKLPSAGPATAAPTADFGFKIAFP